MQTFVPDSNFEESASLLDRELLRDQCKQNVLIMEALVTADCGREPVVQMWVGYEWAFLMYQYAMCFEWHIMRGYDEPEGWLRATINLFYKVPWFMDNQDIYPFWLGDEDFHWRHQSNLLRRDPEWYGPMFPKDLPDNLQFVWPV